MTTTVVPAGSTEDVLSAPQEVHSEREHSAHGTPTRDEGDVLIIELPTCERERGRLVHPCGGDHAKGAQDGICER